MLSNYNVHIFILLISHLLAVYCNQLFLNNEFSLFQIIYFMSITYAHKKIMLWDIAVFLFWKKRKVGKWFLYIET